MIIVDLDDFCEDARSMHDLLRLEEIRHQIPTFKVTLFTIPGCCDAAWFKIMQDGYPWLDFVQHGWHHASNYECLSWDEHTCRQRLRDAREMGFKTKGFKAPGWQISDACYRVLLDEGYWIADQEYNNARRPHGLPAYTLRPESIHGHIGHLGGRNVNALEFLRFDILTAGRSDPDFRFIREVMP